ncbi:subtype I-C CRISPR-associated endonuclease Cas1 [Moraxella caviae]|uniref:CRISPR-associated endonuclease Cas1 n=1 Tax=Moraxella caviae TaxID=34060 RepID=A0A1T0A4L5_9GAMM|nr:type I-C CRISPR-associated endonuclease Cas1c [Moraxella caviae]OOR90703.1 subtype I-C CRISPR-associated endonuclease Cas1 [Moraxella caviae]STZ14850.1 CRISPR-associated endonuclease Cas1, subtype I-C/DVULG [Moraxella caviae]
MRLLKNTLYVQTQGSYLHKDGENLVLKIEHEIKARIPVHKLEGLVCFGNVMVTPALMEHCTNNGITITHLNRFGKFQARIEGGVSGNVLLRRQQYRICDDDKRSVPICQTIVLGKVYNQRQVIARYLRDYKDKLNKQDQEQLEIAQTKLKRLQQSVLTTNTLPQLLGKEGEAASLYFGVFGLLIRNDAFEFTSRSRRPPSDEMNALLSLAYTLLAHDCRSALETVGLDPQCGFFHQLRAGRVSLALDLMEEFRPMIDRFALSLVNKRQLGRDDFVRKENGAVLLDEDARKRFLSAWQDRKQQKIYHAWFDETVPFGLLPHLQAVIMARHIRGDIDSYVPFLWQ